MSKSSGKIKTISELEKDGICPLAYKYFCYTAHYRKPLSWSDSAMKSAVSSFKRLKNVIGSLEDDEKVNKKYLREFEARINDDLDMPGAVAVLWGMLRDKKAEGKVGTIRKMDEVFGLDLLKLKVPTEIIKLADERKKTRDKKDWKKADELRKQINKQGYDISDTDDGGYFISGAAYVAK